ncbi:alginate export protein [Chitinophaga skermanii]|uniref:Alginate export protein n=1 Tax=Chitinophaga skermanii TaxID=331697 RepID=A0A327QKS9_9BACT|nr:alginate export family protein [Chitinophaga skermanii]RAJ04292.1 alginate export protein [Chitinophaga skermanii]
MKKLFLGIIFTSSIPIFATAQFSIGAQLRTRSEFRDGQGAPLPKSAHPAFFNSQRTRLMAKYNSNRVKVHIAIQDVRVWGQDVSTINRTTTQDNNGFMLHEAWAEVNLSDSLHTTRYWGLKVGRQELVYDDSRLLGNLDWLQQGRRHDAAVLKYEIQTFQAHIGGAFNQNKENSTNTIYNAQPPGNYTANTNGGSAYKALAYVHLNKKLQQGNLTYLFLNDHFSKYHFELVDQVQTKKWDEGTYARYTTGLYYIQQLGKFTYNASAYYQFGKTPAGQNLLATSFNGNIAYSITQQLSTCLGADYTSGGDNKAFDPLYGTAHKFWGYMDYFYAASGFGQKGLQDYYLKMKYKPAAKCLLLLDIHQFYSASEVVNHHKQFGTEADLTAQFNINSFVNVDIGYSHFWSTNTLTSATVKNLVNASSNSNWAYVSLNITPSFFIK